MPKAALSKRQQTVKSRDDYIRGLIDGAMSRYEYSNKEVAEKALMPLSSFTEKKREPHKFKLDELYRVFDVLKIFIFFKGELGPDEA